MTDQIKAPTPQGEAVAWRIEDLILPQVTITEDADYARRKAEYRYEGEATARVTPLYAAPVPDLEGERLREDEIVRKAICLFQAFVGGSASREVQNGTMTKDQAASWKAHAIRQHENSLRELAGVAALKDRP